jgi:hypothetical protein
MEQKLRQFKVTFDLRLEYHEHVFFKNQMPFALVGEKKS